MAVDKRVVIGLLVVLIIGGVAVYYLNNKGQKSQSTAPAKKKAPQTASKPVQSGYYHLQSVSSGLYLNKNGILNKNMSDGTSFYVNVDTNAIDPEPDLNITQGDLPGSFINIYFTNSGGILGITAPKQPVYYIPVGTTGSGNTGMVTGNIIPINQAESQPQYLFQFVSA